MPTVITADEYLTVNSIPLATPGWRALSMAPLLDDPPMRGADGLIPQASGRRPFIRRRDSDVRTFPFAVFGHFDHEGTPYDDRRMGAIENLEYLKANLGIASSSGDGTVPAVWHRRDDSEWIADVHVIGFVGARKVGGGVVIRTTLDLSIPAGIFVESP